MKLAQLFKAFSKDENGAVTVDWVVLTAAIVGLGMVVVMVGVLIAADVGEATWSAGVAPTTHRR